MHEAEVTTFRQYKSRARAAAKVRKGTRLHEICSAAFLTYSSRPPLCCNLLCNLALVIVPACHTEPECHQVSARLCNQPVKFSSLDLASLGSQGAALSIDAKLLLLALFDCNAGVWPPLLE